jgi:hypothetical protein
MLDLSREFAPLRRQIAELRFHARRAIRILAKSLGF